MADGRFCGFLDTAIGILLEPVADLHEADRGSDDEFAAPGLLIAGRQGTNARILKKGCPGHSSNSASRKHQITRHPWRTSPPLRPRLSFRYTQWLPLR